MRKGIFVGILAYSGCTAETLEDYCRFTFHLGRRCTEYDFFLGVRSKLEQYRARNSFVEAAIQTGCSYLLMLDDDHVIDYTGSVAPNAQYGFLDKFIKYMDDDPKKGIIGALYYQRDSGHNPVVMRKGPDDKFYWYKDEEIEHKLQEVDVTGGGCILLNMKIFDYIPSPWFEPESLAAVSTDIQICNKVKEKGFTVWCDTSVEIGHVKTQRTIVTRENRGQETDAVLRVADKISDDWAFTSMMTLYNIDVGEYTNLSWENLEESAKRYVKKMPGMVKYHKDPKEYYKKLGDEQIARQWLFHNNVQYGTGTMLKIVLNSFTGMKLKGLDFGCGTSPIGFEMARIGYPMDFVDIEGASAYDFMKWRVKKRNVENVGWKIKGPYDFVLLFHIIEHLKDWKEDLGNIVDHLVDGGKIFTNYFLVTDALNSEHINMDHAGVRKFLLGKNVYPIDIVTWRKSEEIIA